MRTSAIRVDRPTKGEQRGLGDLVDDAAGVDVEELHAAELAPADVALDLLLEEGALTLIVLRQLPAHGASIANVCSLDATDGWTRSLLGRRGAPAAVSTPAAPLPP